MVEDYETHKHKQPHHSTSPFLKKSNEQYISRKNKTANFNSIELKKSQQIQQLEEGIKEERSQRALKTKACPVSEWKTDVVEEINNPVNQSNFA